MSRVHLPRNLEQALALLAEIEGAEPMAGGTDLLPRRRAAGGASGETICLEHVEELQGVTEEEDCLRIGAGVTFASTLANPLIRERLPLLARAADCMGSPLIRNAATLGGNVCTASPAADSLPPLYALNARVELAGAQGRRELPVEAFVQGPRRTALQPGELLVALRVPLEEFPCQFFEKVGQRRALAISIVSLAAALRLDLKGRVEEVRLAYGSAGPIVLRCLEAEEALRGSKPSTAALERAAALVRQSVSPISDLRASADYRRSIAGALLHRLTPR